jgi:hypothetical protein
LKDLPKKFMFYKRAEILCFGDLCVPCGNKEGDFLSPKSKSRWLFSNQFSLCDEGTREESHMALFADAAINSLPLRQLENTAVFSRACHAFGDGSILWLR